MDPATRHPLVLVVDDDLDTRELYRVVLESVGYRVADAAQVAGAAAALAETVPDIVVTDWLLPDGDGLAVCEALHSRGATRGVPVVVISGLVLKLEQESMARARGCVNVLVKPTDPDGILRAVQSALTIGTDGRVRAAAARTKRYVARLNRSAQTLRADVEGSRAEAAALLGRAAERSGRSISLILADDSAHYVAASGATRELTGYEPGELTDMSLWDLTAPSDVPHSQGMWQRFIASGIQEGSVTLRRRDGQTVAAQYYAIANIAPGLHISAIAEASQMPQSLAAH